jgi:hypothetical protein
LVVTPDNCAEGCAVSVHVSTQNDYSHLQKITLERSLPGMWVEEDSVVAPIPIPNPDWTLTCVFNEHYTDGPHTFRVVFNCENGSKDYSYPVFVTADRNVPVAITAFEGEHTREGVMLRWAIAPGMSIEGFNIYRSLGRDASFSRLNGQLIPSGGASEYIDEDTAPGKTYWYRLGAVADHGEWMSQVVSVVVPAAALALYQNVPNPFNPTTVISFMLPQRARAMLAIYDVEGRLVRTLVDEVLDGGTKETTWDATDAQGHPVSSGVYLYRLEVGNQTITKKLTILK